VTEEATSLRLPSDALVVTVGASASGKSTWARAHFRDVQVVSSDDLRARVGESEVDQRASADAFAVLDRVVEARCRRGLLTVVDATSAEAERRASYVDVAHRYDRPVVAVVFDVPTRELLARNRTRRDPVPQAVLRRQVRTLAAVRDGLADEGFDRVVPPTPVEVVPPTFLDAPDHAARQRRSPVPLSFGLSVPRFDWTTPERLGRDLAAVARAAERTGFDSIWVMDHLLQIPSFGPVWDPMLEGYTTLAWLAAATERLRVGLLVGAITYRNPALVGKAVATLDVLSGGRAMCGLGAAWFEREHAAYGWDFPPLRERYARLEDALELLPLLWGPGNPAFEGRTITLAEATCYPRPLQEPHPPILVGGVGERRTLRLVARHAQMCNLPGDVDLVRRKVQVLRDHCAEVGRDPDEVEVTQLGAALVAADRDALDAIAARLRPGELAPETWAARVHAGTVEDHVGRFRALADEGVGTCIVSLPELGPALGDPDRAPEVVEAFAPVVAAFRP
jgi:F420-dependent oxidoreductase-like protein